MPSIARLVHLAESFGDYGNPFEILMCHLVTRSEEMTIVDRKTRVSVKALRTSYPMFRDAWYHRDYDVAGCPLREGDVVVDVGANHGFFTCYAAQRGARVYAFEPNPKTFEFLKENIARNGFADRVNAQCTAIADFDGETELQCYPDHDGWDTISPERDRAVSGLFKWQKERVPVKVGRLSPLIPSEGNIRLLKLDCEGAELAILRDLKSIERFDSLALEFHASAYSIEALVELLLSFRTHQVYVFHDHIVQAIRSEILLEFARSMNDASLLER
jgi:FkbM family methyltransferase